MIDGVIKDIVLYHVHVTRIPEAIIDFADDLILLWNMEIVAIQSIFDIETLVIESFDDLKFNIIILKW